MVVVGTMEKSTVVAAVVVVAAAKHKMKFRFK
jgi:hypothetical protein